MLNRKEPHPGKMVKFQIAESLFNLRNNMPNVIAKQIDALIENGFESFHRVKADGSSGLRCISYTLLMNAIRNVNEFARVY